MVAVVKAQRAHHINCADVVLSNSSHVCCIITHCQDATMNARVQCLDAAWGKG